MFAVSMGAHPGQFFFADTVIVISIAVLLYTVARCYQQKLAVGCQCDLKLENSNFVSAQYAIKTSKMGASSRSENDKNRYSTFPRMDMPKQ